MVPIKKEERPPPQLKREEKIVYPRRESSIFKMPIKKPASPTLIAPIDPLSLLEPTFFEENPVPLKFKEHIVKKVLPKKLKKRKLSEHHEPVSLFHVQNVPIIWSSSISCVQSVQQESNRYSVKKNKRYFSLFFSA